jgi:hypothetical protein
MEIMEEKTMRNTMNDLSFDHAKLDYEAMVRTAEIAFGRLLENIDEHTSLLRKRSYKKPSLRSEWLLNDAKGLAIVAETLETLYGCRTRGTIEIVNVRKEEEEGDYDDEANENQTNS